MLQGKVGFVTGASKGMGTHFVRQMVALGARVACAARPSAELEALAAEFGDKVLLVPCDASDRAQVFAAVDKTVAHFGRLDYMVANAAIFAPFDFETGSEELIRRHIDLNLLGAAWCMQAAIPHLKKTSGLIVAISSETVNMPYALLSAYVATKAGLEGLCGAVREEMRPHGVRVCVLRSGAVAGGSGHENWDADMTARFYETSIRTGRFAFTGQAATPESMADALTKVLSLPHDISIDTIDVRSSRPPLPVA